MAVESDVRYRIDRNLENKNWILDPASTNRNVFFETVPDPFKSKLAGTRPDYSLFKKEQGYYIPIAVIEAKKSGADLNKALETRHQLCKKN